MRKKGIVLLLILVIAGCSSQVSETVINATCGPFKESSFGEWVNITLPEGADSPKLTLEIYRQVHDLSPNYFKYYYCNRNCDMPREELMKSIRMFECESKDIKMRCAYDHEGWVCMNLTG